MGSLPVEAIAARLDDRFRLLTAGPRTALPRQQTLRATLDWSYGLLTEGEQRLLEYALLEASDDDAAEELHLSEDAVKKRWRSIYAKVEIADPHQKSRILWENLSPKKRTWLDERQFCSLEFEALDQRRFRIEPESFRSEFWTPTVGVIRASRIADSRATQSVQRAPGFDSYCVSFMERGESQLVQPRLREPVIGDSATGLVFINEPRTRYASSDDSLRLSLWFPGKLVRQRLEFLLDGQKVDSVAFQTAFDQTRGPGATIRHMLDFLFAELGASD